MEGTKPLCHNSFMIKVERPNGGHLTKPATDVKIKERGKKRKYRKTEERIKPDRAYLEIDGGRKKLTILPSPQRG